MPRTILGIDLGTAQIKLTLMELSGKKASLIGQERLSRDRNASAESVAEGIRQAIDVMGLSASRTVLCLNSRQALLIPLSFPFTQTTKIREVLPFELESRISVDMEAYHWGFLHLDGAESGSSRILAAMYPRAALSEWLHAFDQAGIALDRIELDLAPLAGLALEVAEQPDEDEMLLDIGWSKTNLVRLHEGRLVALTSISSGLKRLYPENGVGPGAGSQSSEENESSFSRKLNELVRQIRRAVLAEAAGTPPKLTVLGGGAAAPELIKALHQTTGSEVKALASLPWDVRVTVEDPPLQALSASLCLQGRKGRPGFDLLPPERSGRRALPAWRRFSRPMAVSLGLILLTWSLSLGSAIYLEHKALKRLNQRLEETFRSVAPEAPPDLRPMQYASVLRTRVRELQSGPQTEGLPKIQATELLSLISRHVPRDADFQATLLSFDANGLRINGLARDYKTVDSLQSALSQVDIFSSVEIIGANVDSRDEGVTFSLRLQLS